MTRQETNKPVLDATCGARIWNRIKISIECKSDVIGIMSWTVEI